MRIHCTQPVNLRAHIETKHEGIIYSCDLCDHVPNRIDYLKEHTRFKHTGVRYPCDQCDYRSNNLCKHKLFQHAGIIFQCDRCDYTTTHLDNLKQNTESKHDRVKYP